LFWCKGWQNGASLYRLAKNNEVFMIPTQHILCVFAGVAMTNRGFLDKDYRVSVKPMHQSMGEMVLAMSGMELVRRSHKLNLKVDGLCGADYERFMGFPILLWLSDPDKVKRDVTDVNECRDMCAREDGLRPCKMFSFFDSIQYCGLYTTSLTGLEPVVTPENGRSSEEELKLFLENNVLCYELPKVAARPLAERKTMHNKRNIYFNVKIGSEEAYRDKLKTEFGTYLKTIEKITIPQCKLECDRAENCNSFLFTGKKYQFNEYDAHYASCSMYNVGPEFIESKLVKKQQDMTSPEATMGPLMFLRHSKVNELRSARWCPSEDKPWSGSNGVTMVTGASTAQLCVGASIAHNYQNALYHDRDKRCVLTTAQIGVNKKTKLDQAADCPNGVVAYSMEVGCCCRYAELVGDEYKWVVKWIPGLDCKSLNGDECPLQDGMTLWSTGSPSARQCWSGYKEERPQMEEGPRMEKCTQVTSATCDGIGNRQQDKNDCLRLQIQFEPTDTAPMCLTR